VFPGGLVVAGGDVLCATPCAGGVGRAGGAEDAGGDALTATPYAGGAGDDVLRATVFTGGIEGAGGDVLCATPCAGGVGRAGGAEDAGGDAQCATPYAGGAGDDVLRATLFSGGIGGAGGDVQCAWYSAGWRLWRFRNFYRVAFSRCDPPRRRRGEARTVGTSRNDAHITLEVDFRYADQLLFIQKRCRFTVSNDPKNLGTLSSSDAALQRSVISDARKALYVE